MNWYNVVKRMRIRAEKYFWRGLFSRARDIRLVASRIEHAAKLTDQEDIDV